MPNIKGGANRFKNKTDRYNYLKTLRDALEFLLETGFNPYEDNLEFNLNENEPTKVIKTIEVKPTPTITNIEKPLLQEN